MSAKVTNEDIEAYERDGATVLRQVFPQNWIEKMRAGVEIAMAEPGPYSEDYTPEGQSGRFFGDLDIWSRHAAFRDFALNSPAAEISAQIMGAGRINFFYDQLLVKEPGTSEKTPWHQDQPYWAVSGRQVCSIWLPLDTVAAENGLEFVAGSHLWEEFSPQHFADGSLYEGTGLEKLPDIDATREDHTILSWDVEPGDCLIFQAMIVHGAPGNSSGNTRRRALATRWCGDDARYCVRPGETGFPVGDPGLNHGDMLDSDMFPLVWQP